MAVYNLSNPLARKNAEARFKRLCTSGKVIKMEEVNSHPGGRCEKYDDTDAYSTNLCSECPLVKDCNVRTKRQNRYLHLLIQYFCCAVGEHDTEYAKRYYYKNMANRDIYVYEDWDAVTQRKVSRLRSSKSLDIGEMSRSIENFKRWASMDPINITLPDAENQEYMREAENEVNNNYKYLH